MGCLLTCHGLVNTGESIPFEGVRVHIATGSLKESDFQRIAPGKSVAVTFDAAQAHDLSGGGVFRFQVEGAFSFAENDANELVGSIPYTSNVLKAKVDGDHAAAVRMAFHERRTQLQNTCSGQRLAVTQTALQNCQSMALKAQTAAESGPAEKLIEYYKRSDSATRATVADVFRKVAQECGSTDSGIAKYHCQDYYSSCASRVLAYTVTSRNIMVFCPLYFNNLPAVAGECHKQDQATTNIHEVTHLYGVKGTSDYGGYGYNFIRSLTPNQNINHADTYALFANAIYLDC